MTTTMTVVHLFWWWNNGTDVDGVTFMSWRWTLATVRSIKQTFTHIYSYLFLAPLFKPLWWLQIHCWPTWRQKKVRTSACWWFYAPAVTSFIPQRFLRMMSNGRFKNTIFRLHFLESAAVSLCQPCEWSHFPELAKCIAHLGPLIREITAT